MALDVESMNVALHLVGVANRQLIASIINLFHLFRMLMTVKWARLPHRPTVVVVFVQIFVVGICSTTLLALMISAAPYRAGAETQRAIATDPKR